MTLATGSSMACGPGWRRRRVALAAAAAVGVVLFWRGAMREARAEDARAAAQELSDGAFALLSSVNADAPKAGPMLAPVANLAGDAQTLASATSHGDRKEAGRAMAAVLADEAAIESAAAGNPGTLDKSRWQSIKVRIAALEKQIQPMKGAVASSAPPPSASVPEPLARPAQSDAPRVVIDSRTRSGGTVRVKGYLEGTDLKSAGIFAGDHELRDLEVGHTPGEQRLNFNLGLDEVSPGELIRVTDIYGRSAEAMIAPDVAASSASDRRDKMIELGGGVAETDEEVASRGPAPGNNTAEIPPQDEAEVAPARRLPGGVSHLSNVQINIIGVTAIPSRPGSFEVVGQIAGSGVRRAGIYIDGRMVKPIPISAGAYSAFDVTFEMEGAGEATIRAYGAGADFVEASIDMTNNGMTVYSSRPAYPVYPAYPAYPVAPGYPNPYAYGRSPYAPSPYGSVNPYAPQPYPYGYPPPYGSAPPRRSWWQRIF